MIGYDTDGLAEIDVKNRFSVGDRIEIVRPQGNLELVIEAMRDGRARVIAGIRHHRHELEATAQRGVQQSEGPVRRVHGADDVDVGWHRKTFTRVG